VVLGQLRKRGAYRCDKIFTDKSSGKIGDRAEVAGSETVETDALQAGIGWSGRCDHGVGGDVAGRVMRLERPADVLELLTPYAVQ